MGWFEITVGLAALGSGLTAGSFFVFQVMVMPALDRSGVGAVPVMQQINLVAVRPAFMIVLFGSLLPAVAALVLVAVRLGVQPLTVGCLLAVVAQLATALITIGGNVPLNERLAAAHPENDSERSWAEFFRPWLRWNLLRTLSSSLALLMWLVLLAGPARGPALGG